MYKTKETFKDPHCGERVKKIKITAAQLPFCKICIEHQ